jgi:hypothetical protein
MCILPFPIKTVEKTRIFVLPSEDGLRQMTFYKNNVDSPDENLMILPFPGPKSVQLHKVRYKALFHDLASSVWRIPTPSMNMYASIPMTRSLAATALPVIEHGSYLVSIAETLDDIHRANPLVFDIPESLFPFFRNHYTSDFGYLICKMKEGLNKYEPLCYSHASMLGKKLFVPTLHYHNHNGRIDTEHADWDHLIYSLSTKEEANMKYKSYKTNKVDWRKFPEGYQHTVHQMVRCAEIEGHYPNKDIAFELEYGT